MDTAEKTYNFFCSHKKLTFRPGQLILDAETENFPIYYIAQGNVKQSLLTVDGNTISLHIFREKSFFPAMLVLANAKNQYDFEAIDDVVVYAAPKDEVLAFLVGNPDVLLDLSTRLSHGLIGMLKKVQSLLYTDVEHKLLSLLLYLAEHFGKEENGKIYLTLPLSHEDLASWIGSQRETVSRQLEKLKREGMVSYTKNKITIEDPAALSRFFTEE